MYTGGLEQVSIARQDDQTTVILLGEDKLMEIKSDNGRLVAVHKRKKEKPVTVDALDLMKALTASLIR